MKRLLQHLAASTLLVVFAVSTFAGDISTTVTSPPPPPNQTLTTGGQITTGVTGQIDLPAADGEISTGAQASDSILNDVLSLVQSVLALF